MLKKPMFIVVIILLLTNIVTLILLNKDEDVLLDNQEKILKKEPVASIDGEDIYYEDWVKILVEDHGEKHLEQLVDHSVVNQLAQQKDIKINEKLIDHGVAVLTAMQGAMEKEAFITLEKKWRKDLLYRFQLEELLTEAEEIAESDVKSHYEKYQKQYEFAASMQYSHIVVDNMEVAKKVIQELESGASFDLLAMEYSEDDETKDEGGYLGFFAKTSQFLPANYYEEAIHMKEDTYSEPLQMDGNVAIIYLHRKLPEITFSYKEIKDEIRRELALSRLEQTLTAKPLWESFDIEWIYE